MDEDGSEQIDVVGSPATGAGSRDLVATEVVLSPHRALIGSSSSSSSSSSSDGSEKTASLVKWDEKEEKEKEEERMETEGAHGAPTTMRISAKVASDAGGTASKRWRAAASS